ncbi:MAG: hypothetical protein IIT76_04455 [Prevotella sp.]|nr:hypothetical protein [Prevotella sp.]
MMKKLKMMAVLLWTVCQGAHAQRTINDEWTFEGRPVVLPHTWNADAYIEKDYLRGTFTYEREMSFTQNSQRKYIRFDGVFKVADVWLNGHHLGQHRGGYTAFAFDVTPYAVPGKNRLKVTVCNQDESVAPISADFTFMGGIYRDVWLLRLYRGQGRPDTDGNPTDRRLSALPDDA